MTCKCIETVNQKLAEHNTRLEVPIMLRFKGEAAQAERVIISTMQIETGRGKPKAVAMFPTYCPFCGGKYEPDHAEEAA